MKESLNISGSVGLLVIYSLSFYSSENVLISLSFLKDSLLDIKLLAKKKKLLADSSFLSGL